MRPTRKPAAGRLPDPPAVRAPLDVARPLLMRSLAGVIAFASVTGCATHRFAPPTGSSVPISNADAQVMWAEATRGCATLVRYNANIRGIRGVHLSLAVTRGGDIGIEATVGGQSAFVLKGTADRSTRWLPNERRFVTAPAAIILKSLVGLEVDPSRLLAVLGGCAAVDRQVTRAERIGDVIRITTPDTTAFLKRPRDVWRVVAARFAPLSVDYADWQTDIPRRVVLATESGQTPAVELSLRIDTPLVNPDLPPEVFQLPVPADAIPTAVSDLRLLGAND